MIVAIAAIKYLGQITDRFTRAIDHLGSDKLDAARPIHAASVRRNLLSRLTQEQIDTIVRVSNLLGEED